MFRVFQGRNGALHSARSRGPSFVFFAQELSAGALNPFEAE